MVVAGTHVAKVGIALSLSVFGVFVMFVMFVMFAVFVVVVVVAVEPKQWKEARKTVLRLLGCRRRRRCCVGPYRPWRRAMLVPSCCIRRGQGGRARPRNVQRGGLARVGGLGSIGAW